MQYKMLVLTVLVLASVIVGLLAGILQFAGVVASWERSRAEPWRSVSR